MLYRVKITHEEKIIYDQKLVAPTPMAMKRRVDKIVKNELPEFAEVIENNPCKWEDTYGGMSTKAYYKVWINNRRVEGGNRWNIARFNAQIRVTHASYDHQFTAGRVSDCEYTLKKALAELIQDRSYAKLDPEEPLLPKHQLDLIGHDLITEAKILLERLSVKKDALRAEADRMDQQV